MSQFTKYAAQISDYGFSKTKAGDPQVEVMFQFVAEGKACHLTWYGSLKPGQAQEITIDALIKMGLSTNELALLANGKASNILNCNKEYEISVDHNHEYNGKISSRIQRVGLPGEADAGTAARKLTENMAVEMTKGLNLAATIIERRQKMGVQAPKPQEKEKMMF